MSSKVVQALSGRSFTFIKRAMNWVYSVSPERLQAIFQKLRPLTGLALALSFVIAFSLPVFLFFRAVNYFWGERDSVVSSVDIFPAAVRLAGQGSYARINYSPALSPVEGNGFLLSGWFKLTQLPAIGQRVILLSKLNPDSRNAEGYAIGITRDPIGFRPIVYWRSAEGNGGWYLFSKFALRPRTWFNLSLSFRGGNLLGLHGISDIEDQSHGVELLGGYELESKTYPTNASALVLGAYGQNPFRGFIGPLALFSGQEIGADIHGIVKRLMRKPEQVPDLVNEKSVVLRGYVGTDLVSPLGIQSEVIKPSTNNRKRGSGDSNQPNEQG